MKEFANVSLKQLADLIGLKANHSRLAVSEKSSFQSDNGTYFQHTAIRLYILLHFFTNSQTGTTTAVTSKMLADQLKVHDKTIDSSLSRLEKEGFLQIISDGEGDFFYVQISHYKEMYEPLGHGKGGYFTICPELRNELLSITQINPLRITLRSLLQTLTRELTSSSKLAQAQITMKQYRDGLPAYVKPSIIRKAMNGLNQIFDTIESSRHSVLLTLKADYNGRTAKKRIRSQAKAAIATEVEDINGLIDIANEILSGELDFSVSNIVSIENGFLEKGIEYRHDDYDQNHMLPELFLSNRSREDILTIAQDFSADLVIDAIRIYYDKYLLNRPNTYDPAKESSIGGLIRTIIKEILSLDITSPALV